MARIFEHTIAATPATATGQLASTPKLRTLLVRHAAEVLGNVAIGGESHLEIAAVGQYIEADYHGRFLIELLQNASDQAVKAGVERPIVTIKRDRGFLVIANQGAPFDERGLRSITSLGLSTKDPNEMIGNKGIGFKAVFEVTRCPEIYSAPDRTGSFATPGALAFRLSATPFEGLDGARFLHELVEEALAIRPEDRTRLGNEARSILAAALKHAAPFRFPVEMSATAATKRLAQVGAIAAPSQTMVVLPLDDTAEAAVTINNALDELTARNGAPILFLTGVAELRIVDRTRNCEVVIAKQRAGDTALEGGLANHAAVETSVTVDGKLRGSTTWHLVESVYGGAHRPTQAQELNAAARKLPGTRWDEVARVPVSVALPMPPEGAIDLGPSTGGCMCMGLPTKCATGTRAWVNSHFFGTISRKDVDLSCEFNRLLFAEAVRLHETLLRHLRAGSRTERRLATLAFDSTEGPLKEALFAAGGPASGAIILAEDGEAFLPAANTLVVEPDDIAIVSLVLAGSAGKDLVGRLPDHVLGAQALPLLKRLVPGAGRESVAAMLFGGGVDGLCVLERAAAFYRAEGPRFWEPFLGFCLKLDPSLQRLRGLRIFPVATDRLAASADGVFLPPATTDAEADETDLADGMERDLIGALPAAVTGRLNFLDVSRVTVRQARRRRLNELGSKLSHEPGPLLRRPRYEELINSALIPALEGLGTSEADLTYGLQLLALAGRWMLEMGEDARLRVPIGRIRVPAQSKAGSGWAWASARECYFGLGWLEGDAERLLSAAYGARERALLMPWDRVRSLRAETSRSEWLRLLGVVGVNSRPRNLSSTKAFPAPLEAVGGSQLGIRVGTLCPIPSAEPFWRAYLEYCRKRSAGVVSRQPYGFHRVSWIDGLEDAAARVPVMEMVLRTPQFYDNDLKTALARSDYPEHDKSTVPSLWVHAIASNDWEVIPSGGTVQKPSVCWLVSSVRDTTRQGRLDFLTLVNPDLRDAARILAAVGVADLENPPVRQILRELERIARRAVSDAPAITRQLANLAEDLYGRLQRQLLDDSVETLGGIELLPLFRGDALVGVRVAEITEAWHRDDPGREAFIPEMEGKLWWPFSARARVTRLIAWLRKRLGPRAVLLASEAEVETGFATAGPPIPFFTWLQANFAAWQQVMTDLGCLVAYAGARDSDPTKEQFHEHWSKFRRATVTVGRFAGDTTARVFVDVRLGHAPSIQASTGLSAEDVLCETWRLVGESYEDSWRLYVHQLRQGAAHAFQFLRGKKVTDKEREDIDAEIDMTPADRLVRIKACVYAMRLSRSGDTVDAFDRAWRANINPLRQFVAWAGEPFTEKFVSDIVYQPSEEAAFTELLRVTSVSAAAWQDSRERLGQPRYRFGASSQLWEAVRAQVTAILRASFARLSGTDLSAVESAVAAVAVIPLPPLIAEAPPAFGQTLAALAVAAREACSALELRARSVAGNRLDAIASSTAAVPAEIRVPDGAPDRDVREYREASEAERSHSAAQRYRAYVELAARLAKTLGEKVDPAALEASSNIGPLTSGPWANRFCVIALFQIELRRQAGRTSEAMSDRGAFKQDYGPNELRAMFPEACDLDTHARPPAPKVRLLGIDLTAAEIGSEVAAGGRVSASLAAAARQRPWDLSLLGGARTDLRPRAPSGGGGGSGRRAPRDSDTDKAINGKLGEIFAYEVLRQLGLPAFDARCWLSTNRCEYTGYPDGNDDAGSDFALVDEDGRLTGRTDQPLCLIEVKSTGGAGDGPFRITENEWRRATEAHFKPNEEYLVIRVADVRATPTVVDVIRDPYALFVAGKLRFWGGDLNAEVAPPI